MVGEYPIENVDAKFVEEFYEVLEIIHPAGMFPVEVFAGRGMPDRKVGIVGVPSDIQPALISVRNMVH